jgi:hypothetical protein
MTDLQKNQLNFNGIYNVTGKNIYIFNDGYQESEVSFLTIIITNIDNNSYKIELFIKKFLQDCNVPDITLYGNLNDNLLFVKKNEKSIRNHTFYFNKNTFYYEYKSDYNNIDNYLEIGIFEGTKIEI